MWLHGFEVSLILWFLCGACAFVQIVRCLQKRSQVGQSKQQKTRVKWWPWDQVTYWLLQCHAKRRRFSMCVTMEMIRSSFPMSGLGLVHARKHLARFQSHRPEWPREKPRRIVIWSHLDSNLESYGYMAIIPLSFSQAYPQALQNPSCHDC